jgi:ssDNA-binding Zn-finger/Zn-ribbon topoisomerase 1
MAHEAYVQLLCPECNKDWESTPSELPEPAENFSCPDCHATRRLSEFMRTDRDLETLKQFDF